jgi:hypothetical protein
MLCVLELWIYDTQGLDFFAEDLLLLPSAAASSREESQPKREEEHPVAAPRFPHCGAVRRPASRCTSGRARQIGYSDSRHSRFADKPLVCAANLREDQMTPDPSSIIHNLILRVRDERRDLLQHIANERHQNIFSDDQLSSLRTRQEILALLKAALEDEINDA